VLADVTNWPSRPLEPMYPLVFFDALRVTIREVNVLRSKAVYLALGVLPDGSKDILIAVTDGLMGLPEALAAVYPATAPQTCIVHLIRNSLDYASWKDRKALAAAIKPIDTAASAEAAQAELDIFEQGPWGVTFPTVVAAWCRAWDRVIPFFAFHRAANSWKTAMNQFAILYGERLMQRA
jgi:putative transposase